MSGYSLFGSAECRVTTNPESVLIHNRYTRLLGLPAAYSDRTQVAVAVGLRKISQTSATKFIRLIDMGMDWVDYVCIPLCSRYLQIGIKPADEPIKPSIDQLVEACLIMAGPDLVGVYIDEALVDADELRRISDVLEEKIKAYRANLKTTWLYKQPRFRPVITLHHPSDLPGSIKAIDPQSEGKSPAAKWGVYGPNSISPFDPSVLNGPNFPPLGLTDSDIERLQRGRKPPHEN